MSAVVLEKIFIYVGWAFIVVLTLGTVGIIFTDVFKKLTSEQRAVFAVVSPSVVGYVLATRFFRFTDPMGVLGLIGIFYLVVPLAFFYVQLKRMKE